MSVKSPNLDPKLKECVLHTALEQECSTASLPYFDGEISLSLICSVLKVNKHST